MEIMNGFMPAPPSFPLNFLSLQFVCVFKIAFLKLRID